MSTNFTYKLMRSCSRTYRAAMSNPRHQSKVLCSPV